MFLSESFILIIHFRSSISKEMITDGQRPLILNEIQTNIYLALKVNSLQIIILTEKNSNCCRFIRGSK